MSCLRKDIRKTSEKFINIINIISLKKIIILEIDFILIDNENIQWRYKLLIKVIDAILFYFKVEIK